jgi:hypothetical protein
MLSIIAGELLIILGMPVVFGGAIMAISASVAGSNQIITYIIDVYVVVLYVTAIIVYYDKTRNMFFYAVESMLIIAPLPLWHLISEDAANNGFTNKIFEPSSIISLTLILCVANKFIKQQSVYSYLLKPYLVTLAYTLFIRTYAPYIGK